MNGKDMMTGMSFVNGKFIQEAETAAFSEKAAPRTRFTLKRTLLIAAIISAMVLLMGCAVYVFSRQHLELGEQEVTYDAFDPDTLEYLGKETYTEQVLTVAGLQGTSGYQAAQEWFAFEQSYDPDRSIQSSVWGNYPEYPAEYDSYYLYSREMKDKVDEILEEYDLKPVGAELEFRTLRNMLAALNIQRVQTTGNAVTVTVDTGGCYENGNFSLSVDLELPEEEGAEITSTWGVLRWNRKDCFSTDVIAFEDTGDWKEWNYTTASGNEVLILRSPSDWRGYILCDREEALLSLQVEARADLWNNVDGKSWAEEQFLTDRQMEQIADAVDFGIQPRVATREDVANQSAPSQEVTQDGYTLKLKSVETDGRIARIVMSITAPEGTVISRVDKAGYEDVAYILGPSNFDNFEPAQGEESRADGAWNPLEDGDGLDNTMDIVMERKAEMQDGSEPFAPGNVWNIHFEDLVGDYWDSGKSEIVGGILAEGEWNFAITFGKENGDYREKEILSQPITAKVCTGWYPDGTDAVEEVRITSFVLRKFSAYIGHDGESTDDFSFLNGEMLRVVMKDGAEIQLVGMGSVYQATEAIDLDQVDYVLLADGTKLTVEK